MTDVSYQGIARRVIENALRIMEGAEPRCCVNWAAVARGPGAR